MNYRSSILIVLVIGVALFLSACQEVSSDLPDSQHSSDVSDDSDQSEPATQYMLDQNQLLSQKACQDLDFGFDIVMIGSRYCPHCTALDPVLAELADKNDLTYRKYDIVDDSAKEEVLSKGISVRGVPVTLIGCRVLVGSAQESQLQSIIDEQL